MFTSAKKKIARTLLAVTVALIIAGVPVFQVLQAAECGAGSAGCG